MTVLAANTSVNHAEAETPQKKTTKRFEAGSILSVESNQNVESKTKNVESKTEKCGVQNSIWSVDSQENH